MDGERSTGTRLPPPLLSPAHGNFGRMTRGASGLMSSSWTVSPSRTVPPRSTRASWPRRPQLSFSSPGRSASSFQHGTHGSLSSTTTVVSQRQALARRQRVQRQPCHPDVFLEGADLDPQRLAGGFVQQQHLTLVAQGTLGVPVSLEAAPFDGQRLGHAPHGSAPGLGKQESADGAGGRVHGWTVTGSRQRCTAVAARPFVLRARRGGPPVSTKNVRIEKDTFGPIEVPADRLWGAQTQRSRCRTSPSPPSACPRR